MINTQHHLIYREKTAILSIVTVTIPTIKRTMLISLPVLTTMNLTVTTIRTRTVKKADKPNRNYLSL